MQMGFFTTDEPAQKPAPAITKPAPVPEPEPARRKKKAEPPQFREKLPDGRVQHFVPPLHCGTSACGRTQDDCITDAQARQWLASEFGVLIAEQMSPQQIATAASAGWCATCLEWGFTDSAQMRGPEFESSKE